MRNTVPAHGTRPGTAVLPRDKRERVPGAGGLHRHKRERVLFGVLSVGGFFLLWEGLVQLGDWQSVFVVAPSEVITAGLAEIQVPRFWNDAWVSFLEFSIGYGSAILLGIPMGIVMGSYRRLAFLFEPIMNFLYAVPRIALLPIIVLWLGLTIWSKVAVVFLGAWVVILLNTYLGVRTVEQRLLAVAHTFGANDRQVFTSVVLPGSVPFVLAGLRLGVGKAMIGVVVAELYGGSAGVGFMITVATNNIQIDRVLFGTFLFILAGLVAVSSIRRIEGRFATWRQDVALGA